MNDIARNLQDDQQRLARDLRAVVDDAEHLLKHATTGAGQGFTEARSRLEQSLRDTRAGLADAERAVLDRVVQAGMATDGYVRRHPWESIGVGAGIGLLVGLLLGRR